MFYNEVLRLTLHSTPNDTQFIETQQIVAVYSLR